ncbi:MAG: DNA repair protein RadC [Alphaproteobacteria bacterium]|nr:DNA repair protein RadC [Alphaproteobacteria bacterium]
MNVKLKKSTHEVSLNSGHRQRVYQKLQEPNYCFLDYEIVEMMLFLAIKRKDVKPLAKKLIDNFGSVHRILNASRAELLNVKGVGNSIVNVIKTINIILNASIKDRVEKQSVIECLDDVITLSKNYCLDNECLCLVLLNNINEVIKFEKTNEGDVSAVNFSTRLIVKKCIEFGARKVILIHNHPSGDPTPSSQDIYSTKRIIEALEIFDIKLFDHVIIGKGRYISFRTIGVI